MRFLGVTVRTFSISYGYSGLLHAIQYKKNTDIEKPGVASDDIAKV
jgi:hypothetical protein